MSNIPILFMFYQPTTLNEALRLKAQLGDAAAYIAGGTDLIVMLNHGRIPARSFIDLTHIPQQDRIELKGGRYVVGGGATFAALGKLPIRALAEASLSVGGPQIRNRATVAGNIASASPAGDGTTALLALDATVTLRSLNGTRALPLDGFFVDYRKTQMRADEIIESISFPADWRTGWYKLGKRGAVNISLVCCAVGLSPEGKFHVAYGSVGPYPLRAKETEEFLTAKLGLVAREGEEGEGERARTRDRLQAKGERAAEGPGGRKKAGGESQSTSANDHSEFRIQNSESFSSIADQAAEIASQEVRPIDDYRGSAEYRRAMAGALLKKALRQL